MTAAKRVDFTGILIDQIGLVWKDAAPMLQKALAEHETMEQVLAALFEQRAQLWIAAEENKLRAACVTEIVRRGKRLLCNIWLTGGTGINDWLYFIDTIEAWAKAQGCDAMLIASGRTGWKRLLRDYKVKYITLEKDIRHAV